MEVCTKVDNEEGGYEVKDVFKWLFRSTFFVLTGFAGQYCVLFGCTTIILTMQNMELSDFML